MDNDNNGLEEYPENRKSSSKTGTNFAFTNEPKSQRRTCPSPKHSPAHLRTTQGSIEKNSTFSDESCTIDAPLILTVQKAHMTCRMGNVFANKVTEMDRQVGLVQPFVFFFTNILFTYVILLKHKMSKREPS